MARRKESAADIRVSVGDGTDIVVERLTLNKNIDVEQIYGSGRLMPDGYSINEVSYEGTMELQGNRLDLEDQLFDNNGVPVEVNITVTHSNGTATTYQEVIATSEGYEVSAGETTTTTFEFMAMSKEGDRNPLPGGGN
jgi:hypothetical protein